MQGKGKSLRLSLMALVVVLIFGALGGLTLARDAFDADYDDCPAVTRLDAIGGLTIDRTDEEDEIRISWDELDSATLSKLGANGYKARLTIIVEGEDPQDRALGDTALVVDDIDFTKALTVSVAVTLGDYVISDIAEADFTSGMPAPRFSTDIRVSANLIARTDPDVEPSRLDNDLTGVSLGTDTAGATEKAADDADIAHLSKTAVDDDEGALAAAKVTLDNTLADPATDTAVERNDARDIYIGSLLEAHGTVDDAFTAARTAVAVKAANVFIDGDDRPATVGSTEIDLGTFYYLGFNNLFDNWFHTGGVTTKPKTPKFRVGLQHGSGDLDPGEADFANYRIVIEDSSGDLLSYQAATVSASNTYGSHKIVFSADLNRAAQDVAEGVLLLTGAPVPASTKNFTNIRLSNQVSSNAVSPYYGRGWLPFFNERADLSYANVGEVNADNDVFPAANTVYADVPVEYFDFPSNVFESDGSYTIKAWAEDDDGTRISPQASIVIGTLESQTVSDAKYAGYRGLTRSWGARVVDPGPDTGALTVYGFSIDDE